MTQFLISAPNILCVCADKLDKELCSGRVFHCYSKEPVLFDDVSQLLLKIEKIFDEIRFPEASTESRRFTKDKKVKERQDYVRFERPEMVVTPQQVVENNGSIATFLVHVQYRQNTTWQGVIICKETGEEVEFRSALEFLKIIDSGLYK